MSSVQRMKKYLQRFARCINESYDAEVRECYDNTAAYREHTRKRKNIKKRSGEKQLIIAPSLIVMKTKLEIAVLEYLESYNNIIDYEGEDFDEMIALLSRFFLSRRALNTPTKFYKFRTCSNQNFRTLEKNCIWMPAADCFLDISDCNISFNIHFKDIEMKRLESPKGYLSCVKMLSNCISRFPNMSDTLTLGDLEAIFAYINRESNEVTIDNHRNILSGVLSLDKEVDYFEWIEYMHDIYEKALAKHPSKTTQVSAEARRSVHVYSMTSIMDNNLLWENYANAYSGFCIEYTIPEEKYYYDDMVAHIFPVIYKRKIPFIDVKTIDSCEIGEESKKRHKALYGAAVSMQLLYKRIDYQFEHEWRIIGSDLDSSLQSFPYISRIIVGKDIKPRNLSRLKNIAQKLNVPISKQVYDYSKNKFSYDRIF